MLNGEHVEQSSRYLMTSMLSRDPDDYIVRAMRLPWSIVLNTSLLLDYLILELS